MRKICYSITKQTEEGTQKFTGIGFIDDKDIYFAILDRNTLQVRITKLSEFVFHTEYKLWYKFVDSIEIEHGTLHAGWSNRTHKPYLICTPITKGGVK